jgi:hypothetical protein
MDGWQQEVSEVWPIIRTHFLTLITHCNSVHATGTQGGSHSLGNSVALADVAHKLKEALKVISSLFRLFCALFWKLILWPTTLHSFSGSSLHS